MTQKETSYDGIDYGMGTTNIDKETGIRYGVISTNEVVQSWSDSSEADYGKPTCPKCGNEAIEISSTVEEIEGGVSITVDSDEDRDEYEFGQHCCGDFACDGCKYRFDSEEAFGDSPLGYYYLEDGYTASCSDDGDIFIEKSPYYTHCQFCSPCAPGAGYLMSKGTIKAYCFGHDWFEGQVAPYPVFDVETGLEVQPPGGTNDSAETDSTPADGAG